MIKPDHISIYVDNEDQKHHSLMDTAKLQVTVTFGEEKSHKTDLKKQKKGSKPNEVDSSINSESNDRTIPALFNPKVSGPIWKFTKVLASFVSGGSVDLKDIAKAEILEEQILCNKIVVKERQSYYFFKNHICLNCYLFTKWNIDLPFFMLKVVYSSIFPRNISNPVWEAFHEQR